MSSTLAERRAKIQGRQRPAPSPTQYLKAEGTRHKTHLEFLLQDVCTTDAPLASVRHGRSFEQLSQKVDNYAEWSKKAGYREPTATFEDDEKAAVESAEKARKLKKELASRPPPNVNEKLMAGGRTLSQKQQSATKKDAYNRFAKEGQTVKVWPKERDSQQRLQIIGKTREGFSLCLHASFWPSIVVELPPEWRHAKMSVLRERAISLCGSLWESVNLKGKDQCHYMTWEVSRKFKSFMYAYDPPTSPAACAKRAKFPFLTIYGKSHAFLRKLTKILEQKQEKLDSAKPQVLPVHEHNIDIATQFFQRYNLTSGVVTAVDTRALKADDSNKATYCDLEYILDLPPPPRPLAPNAPEEPDNDDEDEKEEKVQEECREPDVGDVHPPLRFTKERPFQACPHIVDSFDMQLLSVDIECVPGNNSSMPSATVAGDRLICICCVLFNAKTKRKVNVVFSMFRDHAPLAREDGIELLTYYADTEDALLLEFRNFVIAADADIITGWNTRGFDLPWMFDRTLKLDYFHPFFFMSRIIEHRCEMTTAKQNFGREFEVPGRMMLDTLQRVTSSEREASYQLKHMGPKLTDGKYGKLELDYLVMFKYFRDGKPKELAEILDYCLMDARVPVEIWDRQLYLEWLLGDAIATCLLPKLLYSAGSMKKGTPVLYLQAKRSGYVFMESNPKKKGQEEEKEQEKYEGARVLHAYVGKYGHVAVLDIASMYPSIILENGLCYSNYLPKGVDPPPGHDVVTIDVGTKLHPDLHRWVKSEKGILPVVVAELLRRRDVEKKAMKKAEKAGDIRLKNIYSRREKALKVLANSLYGICGATTGNYAFRPIAASITAFGRVVILGIKTIVEAEFRIKVIYGDTDSIMLMFLDIPDTTEGRQAMFELGDRVAARINSVYDKIKIIVEKVFSPFLLMGMKRYLGVVVEKGSAVIESYEGMKPLPKVEQKGFASIRRDVCKFHQQLMFEIGTVAMFRDRPLARTKALLKTALDLLLAKRVPVEDLAQTMKLKESYKKGENQPAVVTRKKNARFAGSGASPGDRVPFVMTVISRVVKGQAKKRAKAEAADDPAWVAAHPDEIKVDYDHYIKLLEKPLIAACSHMIPRHLDPEVEIPRWLHDARVQAEYLATGTRSFKETASWGPATPTNDDKRRESDIHLLDDPEEEKALPPVAVLSALRQQTLFTQPAPPQPPPPAESRGVKRSSPVQEEEKEHSVPKKPKFSDVVPERHAAMPPKKAEAEQDVKKRPDDPKKQKPLPATPQRHFLQLAAASSFHTPKKRQWEPSTFSPSSLLLAQMKTKPASPHTTTPVSQNKRQSWVPK